MLNTWIHFIILYHYIILMPEYENWSERFQVKTSRSFIMTSRSFIMNSWNFVENIFLFKLFVTKSFSCLLCNCHYHLNHHMNCNIIWIFVDFFHLLFPFIFYLKFIDFPSKSNNVFLKWKKIQIVLAGWPFILFYSSNDKQFIFCTILNLKME